MSTPSFIVGTGRCGSTMLSNMLREHPKVLSLSEFFSLIDDGTGAAFTEKPMDGQQFWAIIAAITSWNRFALQKGVMFSEWLYRFDTAGARFTSQTGVPGIMMTTLPHLFEDHERVFDILRDEVWSWPTGTAKEHYDHLFGWLARRLGKSHWVERSGISLHRIEHLLAMYPNARFIHIVRDGREAAVSIQGHVAFRLLQVVSRIGQHLGVDPLASRDRTNVDRVPDELLRFLPEFFDAEAFRSFRLSLSDCGRFWTQQIKSGLAMLRSVPPECMLTLRYEDFFTDPKQQLDRLTLFLGDEFVDQDWSARCAATIRPPRSTWRDLSGEEASALTEACRPGFELLRAAGVEYQF